MIGWLATTALALEVDPHGRWVEDEQVAFGQARGALTGGILFPVIDGDRPVGFVFVGDASLDVPVATSGEALSLRAAVPDLGVGAGERWAEPGEVLLAIGLRPELLAAVELGHPLEEDPKTISFVDETGHQQVLVSALTPRRALDRARDALRARGRALTAARLDPQAMLAREAFREGEARAIVELRPEHDLGPLIGAVDDSADLGRTWLTWVVDPSGLVDDTRSQVLAVHGQGADDHPLRILSGVPRSGEAEWSAVRGEVNLVLERPIGSAALARSQVRLQIRAGGGGRWVDVWLPRTETTLRQGQIPIVGDPVLTLATTGEGEPLEPVELPFGPDRAGSDWIARSWLLPESVGAGETVDLRLDWEERWDVSGILQVPEWAIHVLDDIDHDGSSLPRGLPDAITLGRVTSGLSVLPRLPTGPVRYPAEVRAGTIVPGYQVSVGGGALGRPWGDGRLWVAELDGPTTISAGDLSETREDGHGPYPPIRILKHSMSMDRRMPARLRSVLHFYGTVLPPWPHPEAVVIQGQDHPVGYVQHDPHRTPGDPQTPATFRYVGQGQVVMDGVVAIPLIGSTSLARELEGAFPHAAERALAEAMAAAWFADLPWPEQDRWLSRAIPKVFRDRFVDEAWGRKLVATWDAETDRRLAREAPQDGLQSLVGTNAWWADEVGARFLGRAVQARIGEKAMMEALTRLRTRPDPSLDALVSELETVSRVSFRDSVDAFVIAGLRPSVEGTWAQEGERVHVSLTADTALGTWEVPVVATTRAGQTTTWLRVVDGVAEGWLDAAEVERVEVDPDEVLPLRGRQLRRREPPQPT
ncbi:MAG: hypothetical protein H6738_15010 [Alphaproteobacteria bacterium]|nr:hypothetical protein [Alphaproteobacteria bacterium]MCB9698087.1 hypothetical protein [Alphaproteobacteria bacterium]